MALAINDDLTTVGVNGDHLITKSDQENAVTDVLAQVSHHRAGGSTARENSVLGDSDNNGRGECPGRWFLGRGSDSFVPRGAPQQKLAFPAYIRVTQAQFYAIAVADRAL